MDYVFDNSVSGAKQQITNSQLKATYEEIDAKQETVIRMLQKYVDKKKIDREEFGRIYDELEILNQEISPKLIPEFQRESDSENKFSFTKLVRWGFSALMFFGLASFIFSGGASP